MRCPKCSKAVQTLDELPRFSDLVVRVDGRIEGSLDVPLNCLTCGVQSMKLNIGSTPSSPKYVAVTITIWKSTCKGLRKSPSTRLFSPPSMLLWTTGNARVADRSALKLNAERPPHGLQRALLESAFSLLSASTELSTTSHENTCMPLGAGV